jgi:hypothetical protein
VGPNPSSFKPTIYSKKPVKKARPKLVTPKKKSKPLQPVFNNRPMK